MSGGASFTLPRASAGAGVLLTAGAGTLPDIDHPDSTISREFGFLTQAFAWLVDRLSGGHRHGTHSFVGIAVCSAGAFAAGSWQLTAHPTGHQVFSWHLMPAALYLALLYSAALRALAVALGYAAHIAGDELTHGGCPVFWPVSGHEFHLVPRPLQITTAKIGENWAVFPLLVVALSAAVWHATGHPL